MNLFLKNTNNFGYIAANVDGAEVNEDIIITKNAINIIHNQLNDFVNNINNADSYFVRLYLISTPTKAKIYSIRFDNLIDDFDRVYELEKLKIVIDRKSLFYFMGILIDYVTDENEEGFVFFDISDPKVIDYYNSKLNLS